MRVLIGARHFATLTGAELHAYELARALARRGHEVLVTAPEVGGEIAERARAAGVAVRDFGSCPPGWSPDVLHVHHAVAGVLLLAAYPGVPAVATVHSELPAERPLVSARVHAYLCVRPEVERVAVETYGVPRERARVVYNPIDLARFRPAPPPPERSVLFVGTIDGLRRRALEHLVERGASEGFPVTVVGARVAGYLDRPPAHVRVLPPTWHVEDHVRACTETAGVLVGRTTLESWAGGRPAWIYDVDADGAIRSLARRDPPPDLSFCDAGRVAKQVEAEYEAAGHAPVRGEALAPLLAEHVRQSAALAPLLHRVALAQQDLAAQVAALHAAHASLAEEVAARRRAHAALSARSDALEGQREALDARTHRLETAHEALAPQVRALHEAHAELARSLLALQDAHVGAGTELAAARAGASALQEQLAEARDALAALASRVAALEAPLPPEGERGLGAALRAAWRALRGAAGAR